LLGCGLFAFCSRIAFFDAGCLSAKVTQVIELGTSNAAAADHVDMIDHRPMQREDTLDTDAKADLADRNGFARSAVFAGDADSFKSLKPLFVTFLDADMHAKRVTRLKSGDILAQLCVLNNI